MTTILRFTILVLAFLTVQGCKLVIIVDEGGSVVSASGLNDCPEDDLCRIDITADDFSDSFTAIPSPGYEFVRWNSGEDFVCESEVSSTCVLTNVGASASPAAAAIIASNQRYYLMPIFKEKPPVGIRFDFNIDGVLPSAEGGAMYIGGGNTSEAASFVVSGGILTMDTLQYGGDAFASYEVSDVADSTCNLVIEWSMHVAPVAQGLQGNVVDVSDGTHRWFFYIRRDAIVTFPPGQPIDILYGLDTTDGQHIYRVESPPNSSAYDLYVDGVLRASGNAEATNAPNRLIFGDTQGASGSTISWWDYLAVEGCTP